MATIAVVSLSDGRLQFFYSDDQGRVFTRWKQTIASTADWTAWRPFTAPPVRTGAPFSPVGTGARLSDGRVQLWTADGRWTTRKVTAHADADWSTWEAFSQPPTHWDGRRIVALQRIDGYVSLWLLTTEGIIWTTRQTPGSDAQWTGWSSLKPLRPIPSFLGFGDMAVGRQGPWTTVFAISKAALDARVLWYLDLDDSGDDGGSVWHPLNTNPIDHIDVAPLSDRRLQAWAIGAVGLIYTKWGDSENGIRLDDYWLTFPGAFHPAPTSGFRRLLRSPYQFAIGRLPDARLQVWLLGNGESLAPEVQTMWKTGTDPGAPWSDWRSFDLP